MTRGLEIFSVSGKVAAITGGGGVLCGAIGEGLARAGARVAVCDIFEDKAQAVAERCCVAGSEARAYKMDVLSLDSIREQCDAIYRDFERVDILINGAGGNLKEATTSVDLPFFDLPLGAFEKVDLTTVKYTLTLEPRSTKSFEYVLRTYHGDREESWRP